MTDRELPPLPTPYCYEFREPRERYTAEQMRAYASQAVAAERERLAKLCDAEYLYRRARESNPLPGDNGLAQGHKAVTALALGRRIRSSGEA